ncbi:GTP cyclohydrolase II [Apibacter sp. B3706]|uniref:GTP cyclohydrolase II n=1 Tax=Apibacter TaxID=1778601 RepID=UPI00132B5F22|nr:MULTISPECIES: GTP cyclohydrolase II [Apibacter]MCX8677196.1 GTP cyclohydrolase II [Apibacter sp. B3919]MXO24424.1 GTP cyclohydrolase II [Apibacter sp. B3924]MXO25668.1 GTP cyclohydrolase II [Apibacter sp. B3813]MXO27619.1 GTP cyclohydrolase II [Apibacter sp. B3913]MXO30021.1 GTP cyclohydrolase II [Apibacter sp. B3912]
MKRQAEANLPTEWGEFEIIAYSENENDWMPHLAMISKNTDLSKTVNIRIHSECITGDLFHSKRCDCGKQLDAAMKYIHENGGVLLYLRQEGRNIGIINKLKAYNLQDKGLNTAEANIELGFPADARDFKIAVEILEDLGIQSVNLLTNNPEKISFIKDSSIKLIHRIPLEINPEKENLEYLKTKKDFFGHFLNNIS